VIECIRYSRGKLLSQMEREKEAEEEEAPLPLAFVVGGSMNLVYNMLNKPLVLEEIHETLYLILSGHTTLGSPKYSFSTLESRKSSTAGRQRQRFARKSSLPLENPACGNPGSTGGSIIVSSMEST